MSQEPEKKKLEAGARSHAERSLFTARKALKELPADDPDAVVEALAEFQRVLDNPDAPPTATAQAITHVEHVVVLQFFGCGKPGAA